MSENGLSDQGSATLSHITADLSNTGPAQQPTNGSRRSKKRTRQQAQLSFSQGNAGLSFRSPAAADADPSNSGSQESGKQDSDSPNPAQQASAFSARSIDGMPAQVSKGHTSWVHEHGKLRIMDGEIYWVCSLCKDREKAKKYPDKYGPSNAGKHLRRKHDMDEDGPILPTAKSIHVKQLEAAQQQTFSTERFWELLQRFK
ncbi:uncharacterized protein K444DRAFT_631478 [Hyaloscypha bicolor E]|uniref:Uncharacterized protein n=1 Tax=Hyaloscypha bicolor E TaxID=1095630 RepID=A0A2J6T4Q1_9HELO|nr:uncharacterized protein K444DRAFT_631478 [Hyaloscypha bicolor E]PMD58004.1 hypothetical protein K444DRAFT_631478 [Hyaloscypha bicolor E]